MVFIAGWLVVVVVVVVEHGVPIGRSSCDVGVHLESLVLSA